MAAVGDGRQMSAAPRAVSARLSIESCYQLAEMLVLQQTLTTLTNGRIDDSLHVIYQLPRQASDTNI